MNIEFIDEKGRVDTNICNEYNMAKNLVKKIEASVGNNDVSINKLSFSREGLKFYRHNIIDYYLIIKANLDLRDNEGYYLSTTDIWVEYSSEEIDKMKQIELNQIAVWFVIFSNMLGYEIVY